MMEQRRQFGYRDLSNAVLAVPCTRIVVTNVGGQLRVSVMRGDKVLAGPHGGRDLNFAADLCVQEFLAG